MAWFGYYFLALGGLVQQFARRGEENQFSYFYSLCLDEVAGGLISL